MKLGRRFTIPSSAKLSEAPTTTERFGLHYEVVIGIGKDHVAFLTIDKDALDALQAGEEVRIT